MAQQPGGDGHRSRESIRRIVVVGGGDCGTRAALQLRDLGFDGSITLIGAESDAPYERPALSTSVLVNDGEVPRLIATPEQLSENAVAWIPANPGVRVDADSRHVLLADGASVPYDRLLISTGARARTLAVPGSDAAFSVRSAADAVRLRERLQPGCRLFVIGGGFIGLEVAASAVARGCAVTVIEFAHQLMSRVVPVAVSQVVRDRHLAEGVDLRCGVAVDRIVRSGDGVSVRLDDDTAVEADVVVAGVGAIPNTELAATAGLAIANGVAVDQHLRTVDPAIMAAGDCCSVPHPLYGGVRIRLEAWQNALTHADIAARNLLGGDAVVDVAPWFWSDQYDLGLLVAGLHAVATHDVARRHPSGHEIRFGLDSDGRIVSASGVAPGTTIARDIRLAQMLIAAQASPAATDLSDASVDLRSLVSIATPADAAERHPQQRQLSTTDSSIV